MSPGDLVRPCRHVNAISVMRPTYSPYEMKLLTPEMALLVVETHESDVDIGANRSVKVSRVRVQVEGKLWWLPVHDVMVVENSEQNVAQGCPPVQE